MTTFTEKLHAAGFFVSWEDDGNYCFEKGTFASGNDVQAGTVLMLNGSSKLVPFDGATASVVAGIAYGHVDASSADTVGTYVARGPAEVRLADLTFPAGDDAAVTSGLKALTPPILTR